MPAEAYGVPLFQYAGMVWKRRSLVGLIVLALALPAGVMSALQPAAYETSSELILGQQRLDGDFNAESTDLSDRQMATQMRVLTGNGVTELAEARGAKGPVSVSTPALSNIIIVEASDHDPQQAARTADAYAEAYIDFRTTELQRTLDDAAEQLRQRIALLQQELDPLAEQVRLTPPDQRAAVQGAVQVLQRGLQEQQASLQAQLGQLQVQRALAASGANLVRRAEVPTQPVSPLPLRDTALALVLGLVLGISVAVLLETLHVRKSSELDESHQVPSDDAPSDVPVLVRESRDDELLPVQTAMSGGSAPRHLARRPSRTFPR